MRSKSQSRSTRCVRATWRMFGERPLLHILITASLSSKIVKFVMPWERGKFCGT